MQPQKNIKTIGLLAVGLSSFASAGENYAPVADTPIVQESASTGWCDALQSIGKLYKNPENPLIQEFSVFGRLHYQGAWVDGEDVNGDDFDDAYDEFRRLRFGAKAKIFNYFDILGRVNLENDRRPQGGDLDFEYTDWDEALIGFDIKKAFGIDQLDKFHINYGRHKFASSQEAIESSKKILTVERSGISNKLFGNFRPTGFKLTAEKGQWDAMLGIFSTEPEDEFIGGWGESQAYQGLVGYQYSDDLYLSADFVYNNADTSNPVLWEYKWATSVSALYDNGQWGVMVNAIYGDNGDILAANQGGDFWGLVIMPQYWIIAEKLQAVARYQYQGSESDTGIRLNSRYVRRTDDTGAAINGGRGDAHHSYYAGLNYHICDHNAKIMAGVELDHLSTSVGDGDVEALTWWLAFRTYF